MTAARLRVAVIAVLVGVTGSTLGAPFAWGAQFGGWTVTPQSAGTAVLGMRATIKTGSSAMVPGGKCLILFRVVLQDNGSSNSVGLIQVGVGRTSTTCGIDDCGMKTVVSSFEEWKRVTPSRNNFHCRWFGPHGTSSARKYSVAKTSPGSECAGCYTAFINGNSVGPGEVSLGSSYSSFAGADGSGGTGEVSSDSTTQGGFVTFGKAAGTSQTPWQRASTLCCNANTNWVTITVPANCQNTDDHWNLTKPFAQPYFVQRRVSNGPNCP